MAFEVVSAEAGPSVFAQELVQSMLLPGEKAIHVASISPAIYWHGAAMGLLGLFVLQYGAWLAAYFFLVAGVLLLLSYSTKRFLVLATTDHRVIARFGVLNQQVLQLRYPQVESVDVMTTLPGQFLGYGSVIITGAGRLRLHVPFVRDAAAFRDHLTQKLLEPEVPLAPIQRQAAS